MELRLRAAREVVVLDVVCVALMKLVCLWSLLLTLMALAIITVDGEY